MAEDTARESVGMRALREGEARRLELLRQLGDARGSLVLSYLTSFREGWGSMVLSEDIRIIERHVARARADGIRRLDLFLSTWGGDATLPWSLHAMLRDYLPKSRIGIIVPYEAYSAGTGVALGGDEIVMGLSSVLGPTDTQAFGYFFQSAPTMGGVSALHGFLNLLKDFDLRGKLDDKVMLDWLTRNSDPMMLGSVYRIFRENRRKILKILDARMKPLAAKDNERIADFFLYDVGLHAQGIRRREAAEAGVSYITELEATGLEGPVQALFAEYAEVLQLFTPFTRKFPAAGPGGFAGDVSLDGEHAGDTPVVLVESLYETNAAFRAYGAHRAWSPPHGLPAPQTEPEPAHGHQPPSGERTEAPARLLWSGASRTAQPQARPQRSRRPRRDST